MATYNLILQHSVDIRGYDKNEEKNEPLQQINIVEQISGITAYQTINSHLYALETTISFDKVGMQCIAVILVAVAPSGGEGVRTDIKATATTVQSASATFLKFDNRVVSEFTANDAIRLKIVGDDALEEDLFVGASAVPLTIYDVIPLLQADLDTKVPSNTAVFSVSDRMGIRIDVTGSTGNTITVIAPTTALSEDARFQLFGDAPAGTSSENLTTNDSAFEGRVMSQYTPTELTAVFTQAVLEENRVQLFIVGAH